MAFRDPALPWFFIQRHRVGAPAEFFSLKAPLGWSTNPTNALKFDTDLAARKHARDCLSLEGVMIVSLFPYQLGQSP